MSKQLEDGNELVVPLRLNGFVVVSVSLLAALGADALFMVADAFRASFKLYPSLFWLALAAAIAAIVPAPLCIFYRCHARLVLSESSLRWRFWGDWRRVSWDGVQDYFDLPPQKDTGAKLMTIRTDAGDVILNCEGNERETVRRWVQARATHAAVTKWGVLGERSCAADTRTFRYDQKDSRGMLLFTFGVLLPNAGYWWYMILKSAPKDFAGMWHPGNLWSSLVAIVPHGLFLLFGLVLFGLPLLFFLSFLPGILDARKRRNERITVGEYGITFENGKRQVSANWDEVTGNFLQPSARFKSPFSGAPSPSSSRLRVWWWITVSTSRLRIRHWVHVVETTRGSFEYSSGIAGNKQLGEIIATRALPLEARETPPLPAGDMDRRV